MFICLSIYLSVYLSICLYISSQIQNLLALHAFILTPQYIKLTKRHFLKHGPIHFLQIFYGLKFLQSSKRFVKFLI